MSIGASLHYAAPATWALSSRTAAIPGEYATWYGWETRTIGPGTAEFRDPRFRHLAAIRAARAATPTAPSWAQEAITGRIRALGTGPAGRGMSGRGA